MGIMAAVLVVLCGSVDLARAGVWQKLETGLEIASFDSQRRASAADGDLMVLRVEPRIFELKILRVGRGEKTPTRNVAQWCQEFDLVAAINAGMYQADHRTHVGFCKTAGKVVNGFANDYLSAAAFGPVDPTDPPFRIFDLDETPLDEVLERYENVVQNLRLIKRGGENRWQPATDQWREAALAEDSLGRALLIYCRTAWSMCEFNEILLSLPLNVVAAQHLEGASPARFWVNHSGYNPDLALVAPGPDLPNILGVARRYPAKQD